MRLKIHKEGYKILTGLGLFFAVVNLLVFWYLPNSLQLVGIISMVLFLLVLQFFRNPSREIILTDDNVVYAPADGKIVTSPGTIANYYENNGGTPYCHAPRKLF